MNRKDSYTPAELYAIQLSNDEPGYFAQIPGIIYHCTYLVQLPNGRVERRKLSQRARDVYGLIKQVAGAKKQGACWYSRNKIAKTLGCSAGTVTAAKKELCQPMEQLGGKPLIIIQKRKKLHADKSGATHYDHITTVTIWAENNAYMATRDHQEDLEIGDLDDEEIIDDDDDPENAIPLTRSNIDRVKSTRSNIDSVVPLTRSNIDTNKITEKKNPPVKLTEPAAVAASCCHLHKEDSVSLIHEHADLVREAQESMKKFGCDENFIAEMTRKHTPQQILEAGYYTQKQMQRKNIPNRFGYLRNAIENGRKWRH